MGGDSNISAGRSIGSSVVNIMTALATGYANNGARGAGVNTTGAVLVEGLCTGIGSLANGREGAATGAEIGGYISSGIALARTGYDYVEQRRQARQPAQPGIPTDGAPEIPPPPVIPKVVVQSVAQHESIYDLAMQLHELNKDYRILLAASEHKKIKEIKHNLTTHFTAIIDQCRTTEDLEACKNYYARCDILHHHYNPGTDAAYNAFWSTLSYVKDMGDIDNRTDTEKEIDAYLAEKTAELQEAHNTATLA